ncbi:hypothetical protein ACH5RR_018351, partial [Cinchona calisaya]
AIACCLFVLYRVIPKKPIPVAWVKTQSGIYKLNVDGLVPGNPGNAGIGRVVRDSSGAACYGHIKFIGIQHIWKLNPRHYCTGYKCRHKIFPPSAGFFKVNVDGSLAGNPGSSGEGGIEWCIRKDSLPVVIDLDSKTLVDIIQDRTRVPWQLDALVRCTKSLLMFAFIIDFEIIWLMRLRS